MDVGKCVIRYAATGEPYIIPKQKRPKLCARCGAYATWAIQEVLPISVLSLDAVLTRSQTVKSTYYCSYHIKTQKG